MVPMTGAPSERPCPRTRHVSWPMEGPSKSRRHEGGRGRPRLHCARCRSRPGRRRRPTGRRSATWPGHRRCRGQRGPW
eukprot:7996640-Alexandrium_andersonii.AAC.1